MITDNQNVKAIASLKVGAILSFGVSLLHTVIIFIGAPGYRYFGAGEEMASLDEQGSLIPALTTFVIVVIFLVFGLYGLSGAGAIKRLRWLKPVLIMIASIYTLRGLAVIIQVFILMSNGEGTQRDIAFSLVSLIIGLLYFYGLKGISKNAVASNL